MIIKKDEIEKIDYILSERDTNFYERRMLGIEKTPSIISRVFLKDGKFIDIPQELEYNFEFL